ncbi:MAG TPA: hypothetical protein VE974_27370 [Thermoanaerobaculia bacterium]|nr:hypothetical protein [Thermoanaerobaculia bacterium]
MDSKSLRKLGVIGSYITGFGAWLVGFLALTDGDNAIAAGVCLVAAAIAFRSLGQFASSPE